MPDRTPSTQKRRPRLRVILLVVLAALLGYGVARLQPIVFRAPLIVGQDAVTDAGSASVSAGVEQIGGAVLHIRPVGQAKLALIFYPGGYVRPQAYEWLGRALAERGVETYIPEMPADLAVLGNDRAGAIIDRIGPDLPVVLAGHSLGGAMACEYAARHADRLRGLILMAAYPADNTRVSASWPALSLAAEHDGLATLEKVYAGLDRLPDGSRVTVVSGSVHAFFGRYGSQAGDGIPTVSRAEAESAILAAVVAYLGL